MKNSNVEVNAVERKIIVSKSFYKKASIYGTEEYKLLRSAMNDNPDYDITFKTYDKKTYGKLTFERMEGYIKTQPNSEKNITEFNEVKKIAAAKGSAYPLTKKWFLSKFSEYKEDEINISSKDGPKVENNTELLEA